MATSAFTQALCIGFRRVLTISGKAVAMGFLAALLIACSSLPRNNFERIEIVTLQSGELSGDAPPTGKSVATGATAGAAGGLFASLLGSLLCGPYFAVCFAATAPAAVGATAVVGGVAGAGVSGLTEEDSREIGPYLDFKPGSNLNQKLADAVSERLPAESIATSGGADARLTLDVTNFRASKWFGKMTFSITANALFDWKLDESAPEHSERSYYCATPTWSVDIWTYNNGALLKRELEGCVRQLADQIQTHLTEPPSEPATGFTETEY